jgi:hypothetical protein
MKSMKKPAPSKGQMPPKEPNPVRQRYSLGLPSKGKKK